MVAIVDAADIQNEEAMTAHRPDHRDTSAVATDSTNDRKCEEEVTVSTLEQVQHQSSSVSLNNSMESNGIKKRQRLVVAADINPHADSSNGMCNLLAPSTQLSPKRHNTRGAGKRAHPSHLSASVSYNAPIRIRSPSCNLHFRRLHDLFFCNEEDGPNEDDGPPDEGSTSTVVVAATVPRAIRIGNIRLQSVHELPNIYVIHQFLSPTDIRYFFTHFISKYKFQRSYVDDDDESSPVASEQSSESPLSSKLSKNPYRTSTFISLNKQHNARIASLEEKVASLFGCSSQQIEALQLVRYQSPNQCFHVHHDLGVWNEITGEVELPSKSIWYQRRIITLFCYLSTVPPYYGGATYFPSCKNRKSQPVDVNGCRMDQDDTDPTIVCSEDGLRIYPVAGRAVVFSNVLSSGLPDPRTIHAGEPVCLPSSSNETQNDFTSTATTTSKKTAVDFIAESKTVKYGLNIWICES